MSKMGQELEKRLDAHKYELYEVVHLFADAIDASQKMGAPYQKVDYGCSLHNKAVRVLSAIEGKE